MQLAELASQRVAIWGAGKEGTAILRLLRARQPAQALTLLVDQPEALAALGDLASDAHLICHAGPVTEARLREYDVVIKSPGVSAYRPEVLAAKAAGVRFTSGTNIWFAENPGARTICLTGSKGKSTTTSFTSHLLRALGYQVLTAGNIGVPLADLLLAPQPADVHVIELSSYQLQDFTGTPEVSVLLNLFPEHLDWHQGEANYFRDKCRLLTPTPSGGPLAVLNARDPNTGLHVHAPRRTRYFNTEEGFHVRDGDLYHGEQLVAPAAEIPLLGEHNRSNLCAALTAVEAFTGDRVEAAVRPALQTFRPLPHRLTVVGEKDGVTYVDDSIATIPQAAIAALKAVGERPVTILVGGYDRGLDQRPFAEMLTAHNPHAIITLPNTGHTLHQLLQAAGGLLAERVHPVADLAAAVALAQKITPRGGLVLLSPGAPSYNVFKNFEERGYTFGELAGFAGYRRHG